MNRSSALRDKRSSSSPMEQRALEAAEVALEASGLRYLSGQIPGLALVLLRFAEDEIRRADEHRLKQEPPTPVGWGDTREKSE